MRALTRELIQTIILTLLIFVALQFSLQNYRVQGPSMEPALKQGQHLLVNKLIYFRIDPQDITGFLPFLQITREQSLFPFHPPLQGEVMVFRFPNDPSRDFVKRVIGVPGDTIEIIRGSVFVNGEALDEPYVTLQSFGTIFPVTVPPESYFVLGDNRLESNDSREWGPVPVDNIVGVAWVSYWPMDQWGILRAFLWP